MLITRGGEPDRRVIYVNRAFCALTGFKPDEVIGEDGDLLLSDGSLQMCSPKWLHTNSNGHDVHWIAQLRHRDGTPFWAEAHLTPVYGPEGQTTHFIVVLTDVTHRKRPWMTTRPRPSTRSLRSPLKAAGSGRAVSASARRRVPLPSGSPQHSNASGRSPERRWPAGCCGRKLPSAGC